MMTLEQQSTDGVLSHLKMATTDCKSQCSSRKQLLTSSLAPRDTLKTRNFLRDIIKLARCSPPGYTYCSLCRQLANLSFEVGDKEDGIYNLVESHATIIRHRALLKYDRSMRKFPSSTGVIDKKYVQFSEEVNNGYESVLNRLQEMPKEWTVIQISCVADIAWRIGGPNLNKWTPQLHIVRMECGSHPEFEPLHLKLLPPSDGLDFCILKEIKDMLHKNHTDQLKENRQEFWKARSDVDNMLWNIINFMNKMWFPSASPFLTGHLCDEKIRNKVKTQVDNILKTVVNEKKTTLLVEDKCLLLKTAENLNSIDDCALISLLARAVKKPRGSSIVKKLWKEYDSLKKKISSELSCTKRGPVLLILDEKLECLPFEQLDTLKDNPVSRIPSLHFLHGLFCAHKNSVKNGMKVVDSSSGYYIINPGKDLNDMEKRMSNFLVPRVPKWHGTLGLALSGEDWCEVVSKKDVLVYMGHGSGGQYWNFEQVPGGIRSLSMIFGCQSAGYKILPCGVEMDASLQSYLAGGCPTMVGMLWPVTDKDTDLAAQSILNLCLPEHSEKSKRKRINKAGTCEKPACVIAEPEVARAVISGRAAAKMLITQCAVVVRGLPVHIK